MKKAEEDIMFEEIIVVFEKVLDQLFAGFLVLDLCN